MAHIRLEPPDHFDFKNPDSWPRWRRRFEQFRTASNLSAESGPRQVNTLLYSMGEEAGDVLATTNISEEDRKDYQKVIDKFDSFFAVRRNVIFERARFNRRDQKEGETAEQYVMTLYGMVENCDYGPYKDEMLRDRIVVGIRDTTLSDRLQLDRDLTLEKAVQMVRQKEAVREQRGQLQSRGDGSKENPITLDEVKSGRHGGGATSRREAKEPPLKQGRGGPRGNSPRQLGGAKSGRKCKRCGKGHTHGDQCPAKSATCYKCNRKGHFSAFCFSKTVAEITGEQSLDSAFLGTLQGGTPSSWSTTLLLNGEEVPFKLDTGAEVTAISELTYQRLKRVKLHPASRILYGPTQQSLRVTGQFQATLTKDRKTSTQTVYVISGLKSNLLGLPAISSLHLASQVDTTSEDQAKHKGEDIIQRFPALFQGLGTLGEEYTIRLREGVRPYALYTPRNVPFPLRPKVKAELDRMERLGVITKVTTPTQWCAGMVVVPKKSGDVRICVDLKPLNEGVLRETHPIPPVDETLAQLSGASVFSKVDANSGFWQVPLAPESRPLTTFITPFGRYFFSKLPFGISSAPELYQRRMSQILDGLPGVLCHIDDVLIFGNTSAEHNTRLDAALRRLEAAGVTLNADKCKFHQSSIKFLGHIIDREGVRPDPERITALLSMRAPTDVPELRRFMGMANQLGKFSPNLATISQPLRELLGSKRTWCWGLEQEQSFERIKRELTQPTVLTLYNPTARTKISADASSFGLGAVLLQEHPTTWRPVAYASRAMSETESRYAQVEKEALAVAWACDKFANYVLGRRFLIETDHKPLVPILSTKHLDNLPPRVLRFRLRLARFDYDIKHVPGKLLYTADTLSRAPTQQEDSDLQLEAESFMKEVICTLPATEQRRDIYIQEQAADSVCAEVMKYCQEGWPQKSPPNPVLGPYWRARSSLSLQNGLLLYNQRIVIPRSLQKETLESIHQGHQGITRCRLRAKISVWWPGISSHISEMVEKCHICARDAERRKEPLIPTPLPDYPWQMIGTDLFQLGKDHYVLVVDYFSRYPEVLKLSSTTSSAVISALKATFSRYGIPETVRSDNGPQFSSGEFEQFSKSYGFCHATSSPLFPQSNGLVERMVKTVKRLLQQSDDPYLALLNYRSTPLPWCKVSPTELLMGRRVRTTLPQLGEQLKPEWTYLVDFRQKDDRFKRKQKKNFDHHHRVQDLPDIPDDSAVWISSGSTPVRGRIVSSTAAPRSYIVDTPTGPVRRNRFHLGVAPDPLPSSSDSEEPSPRRIVTRSQTGTETRLPLRYRT